MQTFYRVYTYDKWKAEISPSVFFRNRENAEAHFNKLAAAADVLHMYIQRSESHMNARGPDVVVSFEVVNFED